MSSRSHRRRTVLTAALTCALTFVAGVAFAAYLGNGYFPTRNLYWTHQGITSGYSTEANDGFGSWSSTTDVNFTKTSSSNWDIRLYPASFGGTGWVGLAYICSYSTCNNSTAWNQTYYYCDAYINHSYTSSQGYSQQRNVIMHEAGHCMSLAHRSDRSSIMYPYQQSITSPNSYDRSLLNSRY